jgi:hypothetical protein
MLPIPEHESFVEGFDLKIVPNLENIASGGTGKGAHLLEDGFLKVLITNTGKNPFWPTPFEIATIVLRLRNDIEPPEIVSEYDTCLLGPDDSPVFIELAEKSLQGKNGIWVEVLCESPKYPAPDEYLSFGFRIEKHGVIGHA